MLTNPISILVLQETNVVDTHDLSLWATLNDVVGQIWPLGLGFDTSELKHLSLKYYC